MKDVIIVGGGIGGLATAIRLLKNSFNVTILEKESSLGGRVNRIYKNNFKFDLTASVLMTPDTYINIFKDVGVDYKNYIQLENLDVLYRVNYYDKTFYKIYNNFKDTVDTLENMEKGLSAKYLEFLGETLNKYILSKSNFLDKPMVNIDELLDLKLLNTMDIINPIKSCYKYIAEKIKNKKLKEYLLFKSMYIGINPYINSNIYSLIPAITQLYGLCYIKGGLYNYILALEKLIKELGGNIELNTEVSKIQVENEQIVGVKTKDKLYKCDIAVCNVDYSYAIENLFSKDLKEVNYNKENIAKKEYSCSVFMIYLGLKKRYDEIEVHNIYINKNFKESIEDAFNGKIPKNPSIYFYSPSSIDNNICEEGNSTINIMVRVPNLSFKNINWDKETIKNIRNNIINTLKNIDSLEDIEENIIFEKYLTPLDLKDRFNCYLGNAFGLSHKLTQSVYMRPHIKSKEIKGLYFIGSSTHPGNGVSVILDGSKVLSDLINFDYKF